MDKKYVDFGTTQSKIESLFFYENACGEDFNLGYDKAIFDVLGILADLPAADVQEARHGQWQKHYKSGTTVSDGFVSSCCDMWNERETPYCPYCGARMDGDV